MKKKNIRKSKTTYLKRILSAALSAALLISMTPEVFAESFAVQEGVIAESAVENEISVEQKEEVILEDGTDTEESDSLIDETSASSEEETAETIVTDDVSEESASEETAELITQDPVEEEYEIELMLNLLADGDSSNTSPSLTLQDALDIVKNDNNPALKLSADNQTLTATGAKGLILLSNVMPEYYRQLDIILTTTESGWNVTESKNFTYTGTDGNTVSTTYSFLGLGNADYPYAGNMTFFEGTGGYSITAVRALFQAISTDSTLPGNINIMMVGNKSGQIVLADQVKKGSSSEKPILECKVTLTHRTGSDAATSDTIGGIIGTLGESASASVILENTLTGVITVTGDDNRGLFCNKMAANSSLKVKLLNSGSVSSDSGTNDRGTITVTATSGDAGGFVGKMETGGSLIVSGSTVEDTSGNAGSLVVNTVTATNGNAGGLVGSADSANIALEEETTSFSLSDVTVTAANNKSAGGFVGDFTNTNAADITLDLTNFNLSTILSGGSSSNAGGVFGTLTNSGRYTISGGQNAITSQLSTAFVNYGGVIGQYNGDALSTALTIQNMSITSNAASNNPTDYGGVIGDIPNSAYIELNDLSDVKTQGKANTNIGGLVADMGSSGGVMLNIGSVELTRNSNDNLYANGTIGGLVGYLEQGVVRLHGTTDLSKLPIEFRGGGTGQIVGKNGYGTGSVGGIVYAVGTGNDDGTGWKLIRNGTKTVSDIGNWGEVVRLDGTKLKETTNAEDTAAPNLFFFDETNHTVTILGNPANTYTISSVRDFAAYALAFDFAGRTPTNVLKGTEGVTSTLDQTITITENTDIKLTGTGIFGIGRDNGANVAGNYFSGTLDGQGNTITLDIGSSYGFASNGTENASDIGSGLVYVHQSGWSDSGHGYLGLIAAANTNAEVQNLTLEGSIQATLLGTNSGTRTRAAAAVAYMNGGKLELSNVEVKTGLTLNALHKDTDSSDVALAAFVGDINSGVSVMFDECTWDKASTVSTDYFAKNLGNRRCNIGGLLALAQKSNTITVTDCTLSGQIEAKGDNRNDARIGGLAAEVSNDYNTNSSIAISNLIVVDECIETTTASVTSGGLLGYRWNRTDVTYGSSSTTIGEGSSTSATAGVTVSNCKLNANSARFGGLVYQATGYWNATAAKSIHFTGSNAITGKSKENNPSGLLVGMGIDNSDSNNLTALYLEVGTWGIDGAAYYVASDSVTLTLNGSTAKESDCFDELVGQTINEEKQGNAGHDNAVVSLATTDHVLIDEKICNTYTGQIGNFSNSRTRYYYNLDSYRIPDTTTGKSMLESSGLDSAGKVLSWSVSQYAASNIKDYFCKDNDATIVKSIDLTGYSYYPVTPRGTITIEGSTEVLVTFTFAYNSMNAKESTDERTNKTFDDSTHQHYLMHHGLLYDTGGSVTVKNTVFTGTVGKNSDGSGALIFNNATGNTENSNTILLENVTLDGLCVANAGDANYAPLLINEIVESVTLTVDGLSTGTHYASGTYAATSLIGNVGHKDAKNLKLIFSNIALDSRKEGNGSGTSANNNGQNSVEYHTAHTIFTHATLLESFMYNSDSSGVYNFNSYDTKVTYGIEISNTSSGRNPEEQYRYYDNDEYAWDGTGTKPESVESISSFYTADKYLRYVYQSENTDTNCHELDINLRTAHLNEGCGTYGHPYIITDGRQLTDLANYLANGRANKWVVCVNKTVFDEQKQNDTSYHTATSDLDDLDKYYMCDGDKWFSATKGEDDKFVKEEQVSAVTAAKMRAYLRNAYYQIQKDISISSSTYMGIGGSTTSGDGANAFSGVIVGKNIGTADSPQYPTVYIASSIPNAKDFGGLVRYSQGSVIKDLTVSYAGGSITDGEESKPVAAASITMNNDAIPDSSNNPFFGGVVGYCMGGDTIIDNVSVSYGTASVNLSGLKARLIAAGGYVGLVGGAKNAKGYEKTGGGVVFRNIDSSKGALSSVNNSSVSVSATAEAKSETNPNGSSYFYCNPYVGRVLDGYACYDGGTEETWTLDNTDKNYTIPDVQSNGGGLTVTENTDGSLSATVSTAQGLWLLSAIVNSGAGAMDGNGTYQDVDSITVDAYQVGKPRSRTADYGKIGKLLTDEEKAETLADEGYWGGVQSGTPAGQDALRISYLVSGFTSGKSENSEYYAARLTGKSDSNTTNTPVVLTFSTGTIDMSSYQNGFRGVGGSYGDVLFNGIYSESNDTYSKKNIRRSVYARMVLGNNAIIKLMMNQRLYRQEVGEQKSDETAWSNHGVGLFTNLGLPTGGCQVNNLTLTGIVSITYYDYDSSTETNADKIQGESGAGAFAAKTLYGGTSLVFEGLKLTNLTVSGAANVGGAIGSVNRNNVTLNFTSVSAEDVSVASIFNEDGNVGGIVGYFAPQGGGSCTIIGSDETRSTFKNITVTIEGNANQYVAAGGLIGKCEKREFSIQHCDVTENNTVTVSKSKHCGGLIGCANGGGTIDDVTLKGMKIVTNSTVGTGGLVGYSQADSKDLEIKHITLGCTQIPVVVNNSGNNPTGGMVGYINGNRKAIIENCTVDCLRVLSSAGDIGGLIGKHNYNNGLNVSDVSLSDTIVATKKQDSCAGLVAGYSSGSKTINGYNILADICKVGFNQSTSLDSITSDKLETKNNTGRWLGKQESSSTLKLVAVAVDGNTLPNKDVGYANGGTVRITYADYPVAQTPTSNDENSMLKSAKPWLDVNPQSALTVKDSTEAETSTTLTGNGVGYTMTEETETKEDGSTETKLVQKSCGEVILREATSAATNKKYCNLTDGTGNTFAKFLDSNNDVYLTTYQKKEKQNGTTIVPSTTDFPILVVSGLAEADTEIWNYIAALTNVASGNDAKGQADSVDAETYLWTADSGAEAAQDGTIAGSFIKKSSASLNVDKTDNKTISIAKNAYDNQQSQFTLLKVKYDDPTDNGTNAFYLYVPVLVEKVLYTSFNVKFLSGTTYLRDPYKASVDTYATAGFDEPVTAFIEYNYDRKKSDWEQMLKNGDDLLWNYNKVLDLASNNTLQGASSNLLPNNTRLTLVDKQTRQCYIHTFTNGDDLHAFDLSAMTLDGTTNTTAFKPVPICDLLGLTIDELTNSAKTRYVSLGEATGGSVPTGATVKVGNTYYRKATGEEIADDGIEKFTISVGSNLSDNTSGTNYLPQGEGYYLTIQVMSQDAAAENVSVVNNPLDVNSRIMKGTGSNSAAPLANIREDTYSNYVIYDGVEQSDFQISTTRNKNPDLDTKMKDGDSIVVTLSTTLSLTDDGKSLFYNFAPTELDHQFNLNMLKHLQTGNGESVEAVLIGATGATYTYTITKADGRVLHDSGKQSVGDSDLLDTLSIKCNNDAPRAMVEYLKSNSEGSLTIQAVITLPYPTLGTYFPGRSGDDNVSGISVSADSRVATSTTQLAITSNKKKKENGRRYYTENPSSAKLTYNTYDGDVSGDSIRKLGINPSDTVNDLDGMIYANGVYDYSGVSADTLSKAKQIRYTLELFRKESDGSYNEASPLYRIDEYLPVVNAAGRSGQFVTGNEEKAKILTDTFTANVSGSDSINIIIKPLTGEAFETKGFTYANYRVRLTAVLLDQSGNELTDTKASDYIIYTNARIYQQMM